jgi:hypothetical protein
LNRVIQGLHANVLSGLHLRGNLKRFGILCGAIVVSNTIVPYNERVTGRSLPVVEKPLIFQ